MLGSMTTTPSLLAQIDHFLKRTHLTDEQFGRQACNNGRLIPRIRKRGDFKLARAAQIGEFLKNNTVKKRKARGEAWP